MSRNLYDATRFFAKAKKGATYVWYTFTSLLAASHGKNKLFTILTLSVYNYTSFMHSLVDQLLSTILLTKDYESIT